MRSSTYPLSGLAQCERCLLPRSFCCLPRTLLWLVRSSSCSLPARRRSRLHEWRWRPRWRRRDAVRRKQSFIRPLAPRRSGHGLLSRLGLASRPQDEALSELAGPDACVVTARTKAQLPPRCVL